MLALLGNAIGTSGALEIAEALRHQRTLAALDLRSAHGKKHLLLANSLILCPRPSTGGWGGW